MLSKKAWSGFRKYARLESVVVDNETVVLSRRTFRSLLVPFDGNDLVAAWCRDFKQRRPDITGADDDDIHFCQFTEPMVERLPLSITSKPLRRFGLSVPAPLPNHYTVPD